MVDTVHNIKDLLSLVESNYQSAKSIQMDESHQVWLRDMGIRQEDCNDVFFVLQQKPYILGMIYQKSYTEYSERRKNSLAVLDHSTLLKEDYSWAIFIKRLLGYIYVWVNYFYQWPISHSEKYNPIDIPLDLLQKYIHIHQKYSEYTNGLNLSSLIWFGHTYTYRSSCKSCIFLPLFNGSSHLIYKPYWPRIYWLTNRLYLFFSNQTVFFELHMNDMYLSKNSQQSDLQAIFQCYHRQRFLIQKQHEVLLGMKNMVWLTCFSLPQLNLIQQCLDFYQAKQRDCYERLKLNVQIWMDQIRKNQSLTLSDLAIWRQAIEVDLNQEMRCDLDTLMSEKFLRMCLDYYFDPTHHDHMAHRHLIHMMINDQRCSEHFLFPWMLDWFKMVDHWYEVLGPLEDIKDHIQYLMDRLPQCYQCYWADAYLEAGEVTCDMLVDHHYRILGHIHSRDFRAFLTDTTFDNICCDEVILASRLSSVFYQKCLSWMKQHLPTAVMVELYPIDKAWIHKFCVDQHDLYQLVLSILTWSKQSKVYHPCLFEWRNMITETDWLQQLDIAITMSILQQPSLLDDAYVLEQWLLSLENVLVSSDINHDLYKGLQALIKIFDECHEETLQHLARCLSRSKEYAGLKHLVDMKSHYFKFKRDYRSMLDNSFKYFEQMRIEEMIHEYRLYQTKASKIGATNSMNVEALFSKQIHLMTINWIRSNQMHSGFCGGMVHLNEYLLPFLYESFGNRNATAWLIKVIHTYKESWIVSMFELIKRSRSCDNYDELIEDCRHRACYQAMIYFDLFDPKFKPHVCGLLQAYREIERRPIQSFDAMSDDSSWTRSETPMLEMV